MAGELGAPDGTGPSNYTPKHLSDAVLTSPVALEGERKQVTVMFCDIVNSTTLAERAGPEAMHGFLDGFFDRMLAEVHRHEGTINQFLGDGFMALFGAPLAHEDHARRAVFAAWSIQDGLRHAPLQVPGSSGGEVAVRIGLNSGLVVVGKIGDDLRMDYTAIGDTTNLASRLQSLAEPGTVVLSESTRRSAGPWIRCTPLGMKSVKGRAEAVAIHRLDGVSVAPQRATEDAAGPMVGRGEEGAEVERALRDLKDGLGGLVLVAGEAGIGKSRLVAELARGPGGSSARWLEGRALSFGETASYWPFVEMIKVSAGIADQDGEAETWEKLRSRLGNLFPEALDEILPYLATLLGLRVREGFEERVRYLDDRGMGTHVLFSCRRFFERLATEQPTVLVFEDVHWIDRSSAELLEHILPLTASAPLLIVATSRTAAAPLARLREVAAELVPERVTDIVLTPLAAAESARLLGALVEPDRFSTNEGEMIVSKSGGNPFFLEEVVHALLAEGRFDGVAPRATLGALTIPDTIRGVIMARVDRIGDDLKETLRIASVLGGTFPARLFDALAVLPRDELEERLSALEELDLLVERRRGADREYAFKHALVQEAVYESLLLPRRRELHLRAGLAIEALFHERLEEFYGLLAHHFAEAEAWEKAQEYLFHAGDEAVRIAADNEALAHYERALASYALAFGDRFDPLARAALERKIGDALFRLGRHDQAIERLLRSLEDLGFAYPKSPRGVKRAIGKEFMRHAVYRRTPTVFRRKVRTSPEAAAEAYASYRALTWMHYFIDPMSFGLDVLLSLNLAERNGLRAGIAQGSAGLGIALDVVKRPRSAARHLSRAIEIAEELGHPVAIGEAHLGTGVHEFVAGDLASALSHFVRSQVAYREAGDLRGWGVTRTLGSWVVRLQGDFDASLAAGADALQVAIDAADRELKAWALEDRARTLWMIGELDEAIALCLEALELFRSIPAPLGVSDALADLGMCYLRRREADRAVEALEEAGRLIDEAGVSGYNATQIRWYLADHYVSAMEQSGAAERAAASRKAARACSAAIKNSKAVPLGAPAAFRALGTYEWLRGHEVAAVRSWERSVASGERVGMPYHVALTEFERGRLAGDPPRLERAISILDDLGARLDSSRAREALEGLNARR